MIALAVMAYQFRLTSIFMVLVNLRGMSCMDWGEDRPLQEDAWT